MRLLFRICLNSECFAWVLNIVVTVRKELKKKKKTVSEDKRICLFFDGRCFTVVVTDNVTRDSPDPWVLADQKLSYKLTGT